jgi:hypothetical protein
MVRDFVGFIWKIRLPKVGPVAIAPSHRWRLQHV